MKRREAKESSSLTLLAIAALLVLLERPAPMRDRRADASPARHSLGDPRACAEVPPEVAETEAGRGREAEHPRQIPLAGWKDILLRLWRRMNADNLTLVAAGVAFYAMLAIFPALAAFVSTYGLIADPGKVRETAIELSAFMPAEAGKLLIDALSALVARATSQLSIGLIFSVLIALWSARAGLAALMTGLNIANEEEEKRGFLEQQVVAMLLTMGALLFAGVVVIAIGIIPLILAFLPIEDTQRTLLGLARWPILAFLMMIAMAVLYRYAPSRREPKWQWVSRGAVVATLLWLVASAGFSFYVTHFGSYDAMYGSVGAVVILLLWFWLSALIVLLGAALNAEAEHQTLRDTTRGAPKPLGRRGAHMADTVGAALGRTPMASPEPS
jgi:membrane protein